MRYLIILFTYVSCTFGSQYEIVNIFDLPKYWKFEIGDNPLWKEYDYDDEWWEEIEVPSTWEDEGFPGYDGFAWYRVHFKITSKHKHESLYLNLGAIDDADETYLNGKLIGQSGSFPPKYTTNAHNTRAYPIPTNTLKFDQDNVIAIKVYDGYGIGGIKWGDNFISKRKDEIILDQYFTQNWKFSIGDNETWQLNNFDDSSWEELLVPLKWDMQGYKHHDGLAWYRYRFKLDEYLEDERLILILGKIDDFDETYLNGQLIGKNGTINNHGKTHINDYSYLHLRTYYIPKKLLFTEKENVIAVRVFDGRGSGGIYEGPIGIITRDNYIIWKEKNEERKNSKKGFWEKFWGKNK